MEESVFAGLRGPPADAGRRSFDADFLRVRMGRITAGGARAAAASAAAPAPDGRSSSVSLVGATLLAHWPLLCEAFKAAAALSAAPHLAFGRTQGLSVSWKEFSRFAASIGAVDDEGCRGSDIDTVFIVVNSGGAARDADESMDDDVSGGGREEGRSRLGLHSLCSPLIPSAAAHLLPLRVPRCVPAPADVLLR